MIKNILFALLIFVSCSEIAVAQRVIQADQISLNYDATPTTLAASTAGTAFTLTLPNTAGAANQCMISDGSGNLSWASPITALTSDVSATGPGSVAATVNSVGGSSAANIHSAELATNAATASNTPSTIVKRDSGGNTGLSQVTFSGSTSGTTVLAPSATASGTLTLPALTDTVVSRQSTDQGAGRLKNKDFSASSVQFVDSTDTTKELKIDLSGSTTGTSMTLAMLQSSNAILNLPNATDTLVARATADTLTNKTMSGSANAFSNIPLTTAVAGVLPVANGGTNSSTTLNNNRFVVSKTGALVEQAAVAANSAVATDGSGLPVASSTSATELGYVHGVTSAIQTQINGLLPLSGGTMTGPIVLSGDATQALNPVSLQQFNAAIFGLSAKNSAVAATTANITLSGEQTIDGVTTSASRVLVKNQSTASQNGIYISSSGAWSRSTDMNSWANVVGALVPVDAGGTVNGGTIWLSTSAQSGTIGTTTVTFTQMAGAGTYTADGTNVLLTGNQFSLAANITSNAANVTGTVQPGHGGTGATATPTNGQVPIGNGTTYTPATITGTSNEITVTNGSGSITLATPQAIGTGSSPTFASVTHTSSGVFNGSTSGSTTLQASATASGTLTMPSATDTMVARATIDTLTNKTISGSSNTLTVLAGSQLSGQVPIANGGTNQSSLVTSPTASTIPAWDANSNLSANNSIDGYVSTATAAGTTTLTVSSAKQQYFTGTTTQTVMMPVVSTLVTGQSWTIVNLSTGNVTVQSSGANTIVTLGQNSQAVLTCISTSGTGTSSWNSITSTATAGTVTSVALTMPGIFSVSGSPITTSGTLGVTASGTSGGIPYFSSSSALSSSTALTANGVVYGGGAGTAPSSTAAGTSTQVLHGGTPPSFSTITTSDLPGPATGSTSGYISSTDWATFNNKGNTMTSGASSQTITNTQTSFVSVTPASGTWTIYGSFYSKSLSSSTTGAELCISTSSSTCDSSSADSKMECAPSFTAAGVMGCQIGPRIVAANGSTAYNLVAQRYGADITGTNFFITAIRLHD